MRTEISNVWYLFLLIILYIQTIDCNFHGISNYISNSSLAGLNTGCKHKVQYFIHSQAIVPMCTGFNEEDLKNGQTIIKLLETRGFLPTCRVMQLMLWMASQVNDPKGYLQKDTFVDIGANIGSCSTHMAGLGFPVIAVEPVKKHVDTIKGTIELNPSFHLEVLRMGISSKDKWSRVNFGHGWRNWGATSVNEVIGNKTAETELQMITTDHVIGHHKVALMKVDCEGCELDALLGAVKSLKRIPMIKMELVQTTYESENRTMTPNELIRFLNDHNFDVFTDLWMENHLYFGHHHQTMFEIDRMFGSSKFEQVTNNTLLNECAKRMLSSEIYYEQFNHVKFMKLASDIIAIEKTLSTKMKAYWLS